MFPIEGKLHFPPSFLSLSIFCVCVGCQRDVCFLIDFNLDLTFCTFFKRCHELKKFFKKAVKLREQQHNLKLETHIPLKDFKDLSYLLKYSKNDV